MLIHLVLQLFKLLISVNLAVCTLAYAHEHSIIHDPPARFRVSHCVPVPRAYARTPLARCVYARKRSARGAARRSESGLGKIGPGDSGIVTPMRDRGRSGRGARGADFVRRRGARALVSVPQRPCQPWLGRALTHDP